MVATDATGLRRGLTILLAVAEQEGVGEQAPGVTRIATLIGREKSQVSRALKILAEAGFVDRDPETLGYRLGWRLLAMAGRSTHAALTAAAESQLTRLVRALGERAHLSVLRGQEVLTVLSEAPDRTIQTVGWVGHGACVLELVRSCAPLRPRARRAGRVLPGRHLRGGDAEDAS